jgi:hypothetical protein
LHLLLEFKYYKGFFFNSERQVLQELTNKQAVDILFRYLPVAFVCSADKPENVGFIAFLNVYSHFLVRKLPAVRNVTFTTNVRFIAIKQVYQPLLRKAFQLPQIRFFTGVNRFIRLTFTSLSYPFVSSAKLFKKCLNVSLCNVLPLVASHSALANSTFWRCFFANAKTSSRSLVRSIFRFAPLPGFVNKPDIPSITYLDNQLFTLMWFIPTSVPASFDLRPSDFKSIVWQRLRNA